jgi:hypothetical protein
VARNIFLKRAAFNFLEAVFFVYNKIAYAMSSILCLIFQNCPPKEEHERKYNTKHWDSPTCRPTKAGTLYLRMYMLRCACTHILDAAARRAMLRGIIWVSNWWKFFAFFSKGLKKTCPRWSHHNNVSTHPPTRTPPPWQVFDRRP